MGTPNTPRSIVGCTILPLVRRNPPAAIEDGGPILRDPVVDFIDMRDVEDSLRPW